MKTQRLILSLTLILLFGAAMAQFPGQKQAVKPCKDCSWEYDQLYLRYKNTKSNKMIFEIKAYASYFTNPAYKHLWIRKDAGDLKKELLLDTRTNDFLIDIRNEPNLRFEVIIASKKGAGENPADHLLFIQINNSVDKSSVIYTQEGKKVWEGTTSDPLGNLVSTNNQVTNFDTDWCFFNDSKNRLFNGKLEDVSKSYYVDNPIKAIPIKPEEVSKYEYKTMLASGKEKKHGSIGASDYAFYTIETKTEAVLYTKAKVPFARMMLDDRFYFLPSPSLDNKILNVWFQPVLGKSGHSSFAYSNLKKISFDLTGKIVSKVPPPVKSGKYTLMEGNYLLDEEGYRVFPKLTIYDAILLGEYNVLIYSNIDGTYGHDLNKDLSLFGSSSSVESILSENKKYALTKNGIWGLAENKLVNSKIYSTSFTGSTVTVSWWGNNIIVKSIGSIKYQGETSYYNNCEIYFYKGNGVWERYPETFNKDPEITKEKIKLVTEKGQTITFSPSGKKL